MDPSVEDVIHFHDVALRRHGGSEGIRDKAGLEAAVARPWMTFGEREVFPGQFEKVAALCESIIRRHPFVDGNKRTGIAAGAYLLSRFGYEIDASQQEVEDLGVDIATGRLDTAQVARWFRSHASPWDG